MHKLILAATMLVITASANVIKAQPRFDECFADSTLRLDYIFSGNASHQKIPLTNFVLCHDGMARKHIWTNCLWKATDR